MEKIMLVKRIVAMAVFLQFLFLTNSCAATTEEEIKQLYIEVYQYRFGEEQDLQKAKKLLEKLVDLGHPPSYELLGEMYEKGVGVDVDMKKAVELYEYAAKNGRFVSQFRLGEIYRTGLGISSDFPKAYLFYSMASEHDIGRADFQIGAMIESGKIELNGKDFLHYYIKSANNDDLYGQLALGRIYEDRGKESRDNYINSYKWYSIAVNGYGSLKAIEGKDRLERILSSEEMDTAERLVKEWVPNIKRSPN